MSNEQGVAKTKGEIHPAVDFIAGTIAGIAAILVGYPFDTVKVRFQNPEISSKYTGNSTFNALNTIVREERFVGLYKGVVSPLATCAFLNGLVFASYKFFMRSQLENDSDIPTLTQITLSGAGTGIVSSLITTPTELIKIKQQNMLTHSADASARAVALRIFRQHGIRGLYRGITATALRDCGYGAYFAAYEGTCRYFSPRVRSTSSSDHSSILAEIESEMSSLSWPTLLLAGGVAGIAGWIATFPFDVVKTRIQSSNYTPLRSRVGGVYNPYRTTLSAVAHSYHTGGIGVFFKGLAPTLIRAIPVNMATFAVFESVVNQLS